MSTQDVWKVRQEFLVFLRNSDILTTTQRGVTTKTDTLTATAGQTIFSTTLFTVRNIRSVTVDSISKKAYFDFTPAYNQGAVSTITFPTGLSVGQVVVIQYDYSAGTLEAVWPDYPQKITFPLDLPRIGFDFISSRTTPVGIGTVNWLTDNLVRVKVFDYGTYRNIEDYLTTLRSKLKTAQTAFYYFKIVVPEGMGPVIPHDATSEKSKGVVYERSMDVVMRFNFET